LKRPRKRGLVLRSALAAALALLGVYAVSGNASATPPSGFSDTVVANVTLPVGLSFTPDGRMLVTTKPGDLYAYIALRLTHANLRNDEAALEECTRLIEPVRTAWAQIADKVPA